MNPTSRTQCAQGFLLSSEPWVPVVVGGQQHEGSLLDVLCRAHEIDGLALDEPLQSVAVFRQVLLPVVLAVFDVPRSHQEWLQRWEEGRLNGEKIKEYLAEYADRFDLFHQTQPFGQVVDLRTGKGETRPVSVLLPAVATGNNVPLFGARTEADPPALSPGEAARAMLVAQCFDTAAIKTGVVGDPQARAGKTTGNPTGPVGQLGVVLSTGRTLFETILLNTPVVRQRLGLEDRPQWNAAPATAQWQDRSPLGLMDLLTWQARRIRLVPEVDERGEMVVRRVVLAAGDRLSQTPEYEPHTAWRREERPRAGAPSQRPVRHQPGRASWRGLAGLLATGQPTGDRITSSTMLSQVAELRMDGYLPVDFPLQVLSVGVTYGTQFAVVEDVMVDLIPLPVVALTTDSEVRELLLAVVDQAEQLRLAANRLGDDLRRAVGAEKAPWDKGQRLGETLVHQFTPVVRRLLAGLQREPHRVDEADAAWRTAARRLAVQVAEPVLGAAPPQAFLGRTEGGKDYRLSVAEARYRAALNQILGSPLSTAQAGA